MILTEYDEFLLQGMHIAVDGAPSERRTSKTERTLGEDRRSLDAPLAGHAFRASSGNITRIVDGQVTGWDWPPSNMDEFEAAVALGLIAPKPSKKSVAWYLLASTVVAVVFWGMVLFVSLRWL